jgi:hypothetical protein
VHGHMNSCMDCAHRGVQKVSSHASLTLFIV